MRRVWTLLLATMIALSGFSFNGAWRSSTDGLFDRARAMFAASGQPETCAQIDKSFVQIDVPLAASAAPDAGRAFNKSDGAIAVLVIVDRLTSDGGIGSVDFSASVKVSAAIVASKQGADVVHVDPAARSASNIAASGGAALTGISFCYRITIPSPPAPSHPNQKPAPSTPAPSPTTVELDLGPIQTANAAASTGVAAARATAAAAQTALAQSKSQVAQLQATAQAQSSQIAQLQSTISAPTPTATSGPQGPVLFSASTDQEFAQLVLPASGWRIDHGLIADGTGAQDWVLLPAIAALGNDQAMEAEIQAGGNGSCPRNFGLALRGTQNGFVAGGIEWACDQAAKLWAGQTVLAQGSAPSLSSGWHVLRIEARGGTVRFLIDGAVILQATTSQTAGGQLALWSSGVPLKVRSLRVVNLS